MDKPLLYTINDLPSFDKLDKNTIYNLDDTNNDIDNSKIYKYVVSVVLNVLNLKNEDSLKFDISYGIRNENLPFSEREGIYCITCLQDKNEDVIAFTNIDKNNFKYKDFKNSEIYIGSIQKNNIYYYNSKNFTTIICDSNVYYFYIHISLGNGLKNSVSLLKAVDSSYKFNLVINDQITLNRDFSFDYEFFNDIIVYNKLKMNYTDILKKNGVYKLTKYSEDLENCLLALSDIQSEERVINYTNRFLIRKIINNVINPVICDWLKYHITLNKTEITIQITPEKSVIACDILKYIIDNYILTEFCKIYNVSANEFIFNVINITFANITPLYDNITKSHFVVDIAMSDINDTTGYLHRFNDGTKVSLKKGDCIIYPSKSYINNGAFNCNAQVLRIEFMLKHKENGKILIY